MTQTTHAALVLATNRHKPTADEVLAIFGLSPEKAAKNVSMRAGPA